jgi:PEP-CTERM motif
MRTFVVRTILAVGLLFGVNGAALATLIFTISDPNAGLAGNPAPYATATVTLIDATHATVVFQGLTTSGTDYMLGGAQALDLNVGATAFTISPDPVTALTLPGFSVPSCSNGGSNNVSSFGVFNLTIDCFDGFPNSGKTFSFTLTNTSGTWGAESDVLVANADGNFAAAHVFVCNTNPCTPTAGARVTGFAGNSEGGFPPVTIPEPQTLALLGLGLLVLGLARRRQVG